MQFHLNGFRTGNPDILEPSESYKSSPRSDALPDEVDVLIVGCGPAGLTLAAQMAAFPDIKTRIVEQKSGPLLLGQADGIACRTMEMFQTFGFADRVEREGYWVNETSFWKPDDSDRSRIVRSGRIDDVEEGLSEFPHVILNQARVHDFYLTVMRNSPNRLEPDYSRRLIGVEIDPAVSSADAPSHPVTVSLERVDPDHKGQIEKIRARYVVGCDGARSAVRQSLGLALKGDSANQAWGVMDVLAVTDFPDIRLKALIQSASEGNIVLIPREGGYMVRIYVELDELRKNERVANRNITVDHLIAATQRILSPYSFEVKEVAWWSVYEIGQRLCDKFDDVPAEQVGVACASRVYCGRRLSYPQPEIRPGHECLDAGRLQSGMETRGGPARTMRSVLPPQLFGRTAGHRQGADRVRSRMGEDDQRAAEIGGRSRRHGRRSGRGAELFREARPIHRRHRNPIHAIRPHRRVDASGSRQRLPDRHALSFRARHPVGRCQGHQPRPRRESGWPLAHLSRFAIAAIRRHRPRGSGRCATFSPIHPSRRSANIRPARQDIDSVIDVRAIFQQAHRDLDLGAMPSLLLPPKGRYGLRDYEKMYCANLRSGQDIFDMRGIDRDRGCMVVVRPDQYVAHILPLDAFNELATFFSAFMTART